MKVPVSMLTGAGAGVAASIAAVVLLGIVLYAISKKTTTTP
jgi:hypothetical protein